MLAGCPPSLRRLSASCSGICCRRLAASLCWFARSLCVRGRVGGVLGVVSECIHCARMCWLNALSYYARQRRAKPFGIVLPRGCCYRTHCCALFLTTELFCNQQTRAGRIHTHGYTYPRTDTHTPRLSRLCSLLLAPRSVSLSVLQQLFWCLLPAPSSISLTVRPQPVCVGGGGWG